MWISVPILETSYTFMFDRIYSQNGPLILVENKKSPNEHATTKEATTLLPLNFANEWKKIIFHKHLEGIVIVWNLNVRTK